MASAKAMTLTKTVSRTKATRSEPAVAPSTFCVLILFTRIGVSANEKFIKLMAATMTIRKETHNNRYTVVRLAALGLSTPEKCSSANGVSRNMFSSV